MSFFSENEKEEIREELRDIENKNFDKLKKTLERLNKIINNSPQQLPIILLIRKELNQFQANIDNDEQTKTNIVLDMNSGNITLENVNYLTKDNVTNIKNANENIFKIYNDMYYSYFYKVIDNKFGNDSSPIFEIIKKYSSLSNLIELENKDSSMDKAEWKKNSEDFSPKFWPLRIMQALNSSFKFNIDQEIVEAINYFDENSSLFIFISEFNSVCQEFIKLYKIVFHIGYKISNEELPKAERIFLDVYINRKLIKLSHPKSSISFIETINHGVNFDMLTNAIDKNKK
ncbi:hypothetical protein M9Y10_042123 [Tritrichomonas musculus]|uniref:Uncharacterized protein n=1 Tax=Tritrichomonas musculus TaxID=1915356 RepID=A0ABR2K698_9EUKA